MRLVCQLCPLDIRGWGQGLPEVTGVPDPSLSIFWASQAAALHNTSAWEEPCLGSLLSPACGHLSRARSSRSVLLPSWAQRTHCSVVLGKGSRTSRLHQKVLCKVHHRPSLCPSSFPLDRRPPQLSLMCLWAAAGCLMHEQSTQLLQQDYVGIGQYMWPLKI